MTAFPRPGQRHRERLRAAGLKATAPRLAILAALEVDRRHPTAEQVRARLRARHPALSLSTVYKTLEAFLATGLIRRVSGEGRRLRVDGVPREHDHAICRRCGAIYDVERPAALARAARPALGEGIVVTGMRIEYDVVCRACAAGRQRGEGKLTGNEEETDR